MARSLGVRYGLKVDLDQSPELLKKWANTPKEVNAFRVEYPLIVMIFMN
jgi:hypothetical protein